MKRIYCRHLSPPPRIEEPAEENAQETAAEPMDDADYDEEDYGGDYEPEEDGWDSAEPIEGVFPADDLGALSAEYEQTDQLAHLALHFADREEYLTACRRFAVLYRQSPVEILRGFSEEVEEIVNLYLLRRGLSALADTDKTLDVYSQVYDGPGRQAKRYERGILWDNL